MIGTQPEGPLSRVAIIAVSHKELSVTVDGRPVRLAILSDDGSVIAEGDQVTKKVEAVAHNYYQNFFKGKGYRPNNGMNFGLVNDAMNAGHKVVRNGWNGHGIWLSLSGHGVHEIPVCDWSKNNANFDSGQGGSTKVLPCITMKTATEENLMSWLAPQNDMLAEDWTVADSAKEIVK